MCLSKIGKTLAGKGQTEYECYKVFDPVYGSKDLNFEFRHFKGLEIVPTNTWLTAEGEKIYCCAGSYPAGFHCFATLNDAKKWNAGQQKIVKIKATGLVARGRQSGWHGENLPVLVFKKIFVPRQK